MLAAIDTLKPRLRIVLVLTGIAAAVFLIAPRTSAGIVAAMTALVLVLADGPSRAALSARLSQPRLWQVAALALCTWMLISVGWSVDRVEGIGKVAIFAGLLAALALVSATLPALGRPVHAELLRTLVLAFLIALAYLFIEELSGHAGKRTLFALLPWTRPSARHLGMAEGEIAFVEAYISNRNMAALSLALWPTLLAVAALYPTARARLIAAALVGVAGATVASSQHESSAVAVLVGGLVLAVAFANARVATGLVAAGWIAACLLVVPIADLAYRQAGLHTADWLPRTARQRVILWGYTAAQVPSRPLLGVGIASTKPLDDARREGLVKPPGHLYELRTGPHAHNVYLQSWYELGAVGALLFMALGLAIIRAITTANAAAQPYLLATFTTASLIAAFTWGMWQAWFMGAFAYAAVLAAIASCDSDRAARAR